MGFRFFFGNFQIYERGTKDMRKKKYDQQLKQDSNGLKLNKTH